MSSNLLKLVENNSVEMPPIAGERLHEIGTAVHGLSQSLEWEWPHIAEEQRPAEQVTETHSQIPSQSTEQVTPAAKPDDKPQGIEDMIDYWRQQVEEARIA